MPAIFDPDDFDLRWPPQLFVDEANRLLVRRRDVHPHSDKAKSALYELFGPVPEEEDPSEPEVAWLLIEAFGSNMPVETFRQMPAKSRRQPTRYDWLRELIRQAANWPEPSLRKPYWSARVGRPRLGFGEVTVSFVELANEFELDGYLVELSGQACADDTDDSPWWRKPSYILEQRVGYPVEWPFKNLLGWDLDQLCDLIEVLHDLVARPTRRLMHNGCGWHYSAFAIGPGRRLYRWRINQLLDASTLGLRLAESGEDLGRLVRVEPPGLEDLPERAMQAAAPETLDRVQHAIALFRARSATLEDRRSAVIALAGILEERRDLLKAELLRDDEAALFRIANKFAVRHQGADQRGDYDPAFLDWLFWWYLGTVELTD